MMSAESAAMAMFGGVTIVAGCFILLLMGDIGVPVVVIGLGVSLYAVKLLTDDLKRLK